ncbi:MAG TPA: FKBP-type peptidyl-prolyl cis-trans isomerase [Solirubrobacterales bacterium]|nr:FKBP-type peptidyl-prolyl cis-trans isomerase [Solirubrobacterales bacterium]
MRVGRASCEPPTDGSRRLAYIVIGFLLLALQFAACGDSADPEATTQKLGREEAANENTPAFEREGVEWLRAAVAADTRARREGRWADLKKAAGPYDDRLVFPYGDPPQEVLFRDLRVGKGPALDANDLFGARYEAYYYRDGSYAVSSDYGQAQYSFRTGELVPGWDRGLRGMRKGGVRELILPSDWAYDGGALVYVVRLTALKKR